MKVAIVAPSSFPYAIGGAENFWWGLLRAMHHAGIEADLIKVPYQEHRLIDLLRGYAAFAVLDLDHFDYVITTRYPAWAIRHHTHVVYMQHPCRILYDFYPTNLSQSLTADTLNYLSSIGVPDLYMNLLVACDEPNWVCPEFDHQQFIRTFIHAIQGDIDHPSWALPGALSRKIIQILDAICLHPSYIQGYAAISKTVANRDGYFRSGIKPRVLYHPTHLEGFSCSEPEYIFSASRMVEAKRVDLIIESYLAANVHYPLKIAGDGPQRGRLEKLANGHPQIEFLGRLTDHDLVHAYAKALFVPFIPKDEDYGLITVEAMMSGKPVLTTDDSGGVKELVVHGKNGWITRPTIADVSETFRQACREAPALTANSSGVMANPVLNWSLLVNELLLVPEQQRSARKKIGRLACIFYLDRDADQHLAEQFNRCLSEIAKHFELELIYLSPQANVVSQIKNDFGLLETILPIPDGLNPLMMDVDDLKSVPHAYLDLINYLKNFDGIIFRNFDLYNTRLPWVRPHIFFSLDLVGEGYQEISEKYVMADTKSFITHNQSIGMIVLEDDLLGLTKNRLPLTLPNFIFSADSQTIMRSRYQKCLSNKKIDKQKISVLFYWNQISLGSFELDQLCSLAKKYTEYDFFIAGLAQQQLQLQDNLIILGPIADAAIDHWIRIVDLVVLTGKPKQQVLRQTILEAGLPVYWGEALKEQSYFWSAVTHWQDLQNVFDQLRVFTEKNWDDEVLKLQQRLLKHQTKLMSTTGIVQEIEKMIT